MKKKRKKLMSGLLCALLLFTNIGTGQPVYAAAEMQISQGETKGPVEEVIEEESGQKTDAAVSTEQGGTETREQEDRELPEDETLDAELPKDEIPDAEEDMLEEAAVSGPDVTRIEWLRALVETFGMEVEADNYPDNYYIDIDSSSEYYRDVMLATEFGLVDVEAGDALRPDEPATREFAVHTLNHCLGFRPESGSYSFSESGNTSYPDDIQVAVEQKWFALSNGAFYPERALNETEKALLMNCAQKAADATRIDPNHKDQYEFADNVVVLSEAAARMTDEEEYTISGSGQSLQAGDIFAVVINGFPVVKKAKNVDVSGDAMVVCTESVALADAFKSINIQGNMKADLMLAEAYEPDIELYYIEGGTAERSWEDGVRYDSLQEAEGHEIDAVELVKSYPISRDVRSRFDLAEGITADISCKLSNVDESHKVEWGSAYVDIGATATFSCNVSMDVLQAVGADSSIELARVPVGGIGYLSVTLDLSLQGDVTFCLVEYVSAGIYCDENGFRITSRFYKESFTIDAHAEASVGFTATAGVDCAGAIKGSVYGKAGVKTVLNTKSYDDGQKPGQCTHVSSWLYASAGYQASADLPVYKKSWRDEIPVFTQMNSPVRVSYHYEDGTAVSRCTRGNAALWKYYTPADSRYGYNGVSGGTGADGEPYTIFEYTLDKYENATITKYNGNVSALNIPETLDGYTVVGIGDKVFQNNKELRMVVIPDSVSVIGTSAFLNCNHLGEITLSKNIEKLGSGAFGNCVSLTSVLIPKSLTVGGGNVWNENLHGAFGGCSTLSSVAFEEGTTQIASYLFYNCTGLKEIKIPDTVTKIDSHAFHSAVNLKKVQLGNAVTEIAEDAFNGCAALTDVMISDSVIKIGDHAFSECTALSQIVIPDSVSTIGTSAFLNCRKLEIVTLSKGLENLGSGAFGNCVSLMSVLIPKSLTVGGGNVWNENLHGAFGGCSTLSSVAFEEGTTQIASYLFYNCTGLKEIKIPDTVTKIDSHAFHSAVNLKKVQLGNAVTEIAEDAFNGCAALTDVMISDSVIKIGDHAFSECTALSQIVIPDSVSTIGTSAFLNCRKLEIVTLSKGLENLGSGAFGNCVSLMSVLIPKSLTVGGGNVWNENLHGAFGGCSTLSSVAFEEGTTQIASYLFYNCTGLKEITIPDTVTKIQENAFYSANNLKKVKIGNKVEEIKSNAFNGCTSLESIETPESTKTFGSSCFRDCKNLKSAVIHATKTSMGTNLFNGCSSLETVTLPVDKTVLEEGMFRECTSLKKIAMPDTLQTVGNYAFYNCDALTVMTLPKGVTSVGNQAFYDCDALTAVHIPDSVTSLGGDLFYSCDALRDVTLGLGLSVIPANTFLGCGSLAEIVIPYYVKELGNASFKNCTSLTSVTMPRGLAKIGTEVFSYPRKMTIYGISGTYAEEYAKANNITFVDRQTHAAAVEMPEKLTMVRGAAKTLVVSVTPSDFTDEITWKSADENIVTVDDRGKVTARAIGSTTVKVMVGSVSAVCQVTVVQPVTSVRVTPSKIEAEAAEVFALTAEVNPVDAYDKSILWSSSDETVVTVTQEGQIMTLAKGTAVITASAQDGSGKSGNCKVTVTNNAVFTSAVSELESAHPYENNSSNIWVYTAEGAGQLNVTFDEQTELEDGFDYLFLYDEDGKEIGKYTGKELAGKTVTISGSMVRIRLVSDKAGTAWGFKVTEISTEGRTEDPGGDPGTPDDGPGKDPDDVTYGDLTIKAVPNMSYTGKAVKPAVQVYYGNTLLKAGKNYTIRYENNVDADQINVKGGVLRTDSNEDTGFDNRLPYAKITGKGNFAGTVYVNFHILPVSISDGKGEIAPGFAMKYTDQFVVSGKDQRIIRSMKYKKVMQENVDYTVTLTSLDDGRTMPGGAYLPAGSQGTFKLTIRGRGGFTGTVEKMICAADKDHLLKNAKITLGKNIKKQKYTGEEITLVPSQDNGDDVFTVRMGGVYLKYGQDYEIVYTDNRAAGTAVMTVVGKAGSGYMGSKSIKFQITGKPFNTRTVTVGADFKSSFVYTGSAVTQDEVTLTSEGKTLIRDKDYRIVYRNNVRAGTASMTFEALPLSGYSGKFVKKFKIEKVPLSVSMLEDKELTAVCTPEGAKPTLILTDRGRILREGTDYIMNCSRNKAVGTASVTLKGKGNYGGSFSTIFTVTPKSLNDSDITIKPKGMAYVADKESAYRPGVQILQGRKAVSAKEYEIVYSANTSAEIAAYKSGNSEKKPVMTVRAKAGGSYTGEVELELPVYETRLTSADMEIKVGEAVYTGSQVRPDVEVSFGGRKRTEGRDYVLTYGANIAAGKKKGSVTVTGLGLEYGGSVTVKFDISGRNLGK